MSFGHFAGGFATGYMKGADWREARDDRKLERERRAKLEAQQQAFADGIQQFAERFRSDHPANQPLPQEQRQIEQAQLGQQAAAPQGQGPTMGQFLAGQAPIDDSGGLQPYGMIIEGQPQGTQAMPEQIVPPQQQREALTPQDKTHTLRPAASQRFNVEEAAREFDQLLMTAMASPEVFATSQPQIQALQQHLMSMHAREFDGDVNTSAGSLAYARHMAHGAALLGKPQTPEEIKSISTWAREIRKEGIEEASQALHQGDLQGTIEAFNNSGAKRIKPEDVLRFEPVVTNIGNTPIRTFEMTALVDGEEVTINGAETLFNALTIEEQFGIIQEDTKLQSQLARDRAAAASSYSSARLNNVRANAAETEIAWATEDREARANAPAMEVPDNPWTGMTADQAREFDRFSDRRKALADRLHDYDEGSRERSLIQLQIESLDRQIDEFTNSTIDVAAWRAAQGGPPGEAQQGEGRTPPPMPPGVGQDGLTGIIQQATEVASGPQSEGPGTGVGNWLAGVSNAFAEDNRAARERRPEVQGQMREAVDSVTSYWGERINNLRGVTDKVDEVRKMVAATDNPLEQARIYVELAKNEDAWNSLTPAEQRRIKRDARDVKRAALRALSPRATPEEIREFEQDFSVFD